LPSKGKRSIDMRKLVLGCIGIGVFFVTGSSFVQTSVADELSDAPELVLETLLSTQLEGVEGTEVIVSRVVMPPNTALPRHWHPGEEFAYVLSGSTILRRDSKPDLTVLAGELVKIPLKEIHSAMTTDQGATILVFRVHEHGKPERVLVD
jgi:quercetin dioxygenase-like cupin family protein